MNVYHHDPHGNLYEAPNPLTLAPILQHWVTEFCRLSTSSSSSSEQQQGLDRRHQIFSLPYTLRPGDLEFSRLDPSQNSNPESTWRIIVPSVKTFGACLDDHDQPSQSQSFRQWYFRPQGLILSSETPYNFDLIAGPGYGKELKVAGDLETILEGKRDLEGMEEFKKAGFMATTRQSELFSTVRNAS
ncbi:uncharacterized protein JCM6883_004221 [Sporobolomyces salmoneus]|uniref:uncharacterized protein n=1 Tax=Sporobolomyces salmoneus TaxID=183962 RepID=UPI0031718283